MNRRAALALLVLGVAAACGERLTDAEVDCTPCPGSPGMVCVECGPFERGSMRQENEQPVRTISLSTFEIDQTEVTVDDWVACVSAGTCVPATGVDNIDKYCSYETEGPADRAVNCMSAVEAEAYCGWAGKRLPTEAEWEKAARGTNGRTYPWGEEPPDCDRAVVDNGTFPNCYDGPQPVGSKSPQSDSPYGLADMAGNVAEWVADTYDGDYYAEAPEVDPQGPAPDLSRVYRGGAWTDSPGSARSRLTVTRRALWGETRGLDIIGFRCARSADD